MRVCLCPRFLQAEYMWIDRSTECRYRVFVFVEMSDVPLYYFKIHCELSVERPRSEKAWFMLFVRFKSVPILCIDCILLLTSSLKRNLMIEVISGVKIDVRKL